MQILTAPCFQLQSLLLTIQNLLGQSISFVNHVLFPGCIYLTSDKHDNVVEEQNFYLIFEILKDRGRLTQAKIHFLQIPHGIRNKHLGTQIYVILEQFLKSQGCTSIVLEARVNTLNPKDNSVGFWGRQGFVPGVHYAFDDENFPMIKRLM